MLKAMVNCCEIDFEFANTTPLLVKDGRYKPKPGGPAAVFHCRNSEGEMHRKVEELRYSELDVFIPASSIRGVFRSHMERIVRSFTPDGPIVCNPFVDREQAGPGRPGGTEVGCSFQAMGYADSCPVCRLFGSTVHAGRISFEDGDAMKKGNVVMTEQIAIDRFTGSVRTGLGPFKLMTLEGAKFRTRIRIRNFELWQLGLLGYVFKDLKQANLQMGMGKNLDRGHVRCDPTVNNREKLEIRVSYYGKSARVPNDGSLRGLFEMWDDADGKYRFVPRTDRNGIPELLPRIELRPEDFEHSFEVKNATGTEAFWRGITSTWNEAATHTEIFPSRMVPMAEGG